MRQGRLATKMEGVQEPGTTIRRALAVIGAAAAFALVPASAQATFPGDNGVIVFDRIDHADDGHHMHSVAPSGGAATALPLGSGSAFPSFSPRGDLFAFECADTVCTASPDGSDETRLPGSSLTGARWPGFSPNARQLVFIRGTGKLTVSRADGTQAKRLRHAGSAWQPEFTPDGKRIVFSKKVADGREIFSIKVNGKGLERLSQAPKGFADINPSVSPDGRRIAYERGDEDHVSLWSMRADGRKAKRLIRNAGTPEWSPDGRRIAHQQLDARFRQSAIAVSHPNGKNTRLLTSFDRDFFDNRPTWQPLP